jgi:hypothetical protein
VEDGALSKLHVAFSRMGAQKDYVQHHMEAQAGALMQVAVMGGGCRRVGLFGYVQEGWAVWGQATGWSRSGPAATL